MKIKIFAVMMLLLALEACTKSSGNSQNNPDPSLNKSLTLVSYGSCAELESEVKEMLIGEMEKNLDNMRYHCRFDFDVGPPVVQPNIGGEESKSPTSTNLQEEGVDEADLIKTDGNYAYAIVGDEVRIARVWPFSDFGLVTTIKTQGAPSGIYIADGKLIILSGSQNTSPVPLVGCMTVGKCVIPPDYQPTTSVEVYDVSNPANPVLLKKKSFSADLLDTRRIDGRLYLVLSKEGVVYPPFDYDLGIDYTRLPVCSEDGRATPTDEMISAIEELKEKNKKTVESLTLNELMPAVGDGKEINCTEITRSESAVGTQLLMIYSDQFADANAAPSKTVLLSNGGTVYVSKNSLYVATTNMPYGWWGWWTPDYEFKDSTVVHRFAIDSGNPQYSASGEVDGHLLDNGFAGSRYSARFSMAQFALSEYEGALRIATTTSDLDNRVTVLDTATLSKIGEAGEMGSGEKIHSVRFIGKRGYVVTFKKTDPLYVIDLSTPKSPKIAGELKVPGFSTYLHPYDDGHLIGLGFGADDMGNFAWTQGLKLALFDVTDPTSPVEVGHREIGSRGSYTPAIEEHHAFTLDKSRGILALPVDIYEGGGGGSDFGEHSFSGVMLLKADLSGSFDTVGKIVMDSSQNDAMWFSFFPVGVKRTVIIGDGKEDGILTLTDFGVQLNRIDETMSEVGKL